MLISNSVGQAAPFGAVSRPNANNKLNTETKDSVRAVDLEVEQDKSVSKQAQTSINIDEQALAFFEQNQGSISTQARSKQGNYSSASQDQPSAKNETAVANYQVIDNLAQRESVQQLFGVDLFA